MYCRLVQYWYNSVPLAFRHSSTVSLEINIFVRCFIQSYTMYMLSIMIVLSISVSCGLRHFDLGSSLFKLTTALLYLILSHTVKLSKQEKKSYLNNSSLALGIALNLNLKHHHQKLNWNSCLWLNLALSYQMNIIQISMPHFKVQEN